MNFPPSSSAPLVRALVALLLTDFAATLGRAQATPITITDGSGTVIGRGYQGPPSPSQPLDNRASLGPSGRPFSSDTYFPGDNNQITRRPLGPFYLPVLLPVLGAAPPATPERLAPSYPREAIGEPFLMAYGNLAANNLLSDKRAETVTSYRTARLALLTELRAELDQTQEATAADRERALVQLAAAQTPRLLDLEAEAEKIRRDLTQVEIMTATADDIGKLAPAKERPEFREPLAVTRMLLSAAHFRDGFSPDQRRLLEEMAQEVRLFVEPDRNHGAFVFFWPAGARIAPPAGLAAGVAEKFREFQRRKAALKDELRAALDRERKQLFNVSHRENFAALAATQAPRFAELDALADEIRPALAAPTNAVDKLGAELPPELARRVTDLVDRKAALQRDLHARLAAFRRALPGDRVELVRKNQGLAITVVTTNVLRSNYPSVLASITDFNEEISARFAALAVVRERVHDDLARYQAGATGRPAGVTVDQLATDFLVAYNAREYRSRQRDYAAAVLATGLSPAQRRLLLAAAAADSVKEERAPLSP